jgi:hypothetical protein
MASFHNWTGDELIDTQVPQFLNEDNAATQEKLDTKFNKSLDIAEASDLNNFKDEGFYCCNSNSRAETILNCPTNYAFGLMVWGKGEIVYQEVREFNRGSNQDYNNCWRRSYSGGGQGVWSNWQKVAYAATTLAEYGITDGMGKNATNSVGVTDIIKRSINTSYLRLTGGNTFDKSATLQLCGGTYATNAGQFLLKAADSAHSATLSGNPSGLLKWNDKNIVRSVNNSVADEHGNVTLLFPDSDVTQEGAGYWKPNESVQEGDIRYVYGRGNTGVVLKCVKAGITGAELPDLEAASNAVQLVTETTTEVKPFDILDYVSQVPEYYTRPSLYTVSKKSITIPKGLRVRIGDKGYESVSTTTLSTTSLGSLAAKDVYIYACAPITLSTEPIFVLSLNSTVPSGYTAENSRKIGGFHCLCADVGTISGHTLSGYVAGDILPASAWDLIHRPRCSPEAMVYCDTVDFWVDIYLDSWDGNKLVSVYKGVTADGTSTKKFHGELFVDELAKLNKRLPPRRVFQAIMKGSNERTNVKGSKDVNTTGGNVDTAGRRMISNYGCEDGCGFLWQWSDELGFAGGSAWTDSVYNSSVDSERIGQTYGTLYRAALGGCWVHGGSCGSRSVFCSHSSALVSAYFGGRGACEPKVAKFY